MKTCFLKKVIPTGCLINTKSCLLKKCFELISQCSQADSYSIALIPRITSLYFNVTVLEHKQSPSAVWGRNCFQTLHKALRKTLMRECIFSVSKVKSDFSGWLYINTLLKASLLNSHSIYRGGIKIEYSLEMGVTYMLLLLHAFIVNNKNTRLKSFKFLCC